LIFKMDFPSAFIQNIHAAFGERGRDWLMNLPSLIEEVSERWGLAEVQPVPNLSYNFVAFATRRHPEWRDNKDDGRASETQGSVVLKIGVPHKELVSEINALKLFDGDGACQLIDCDEEKGFLLIERLKPGTMLADLDDDDERTHIAMDVMENLILGRGEITSPLRDTFINLSDWFDGLKEVRPAFKGGRGPIPEKIFEQVEAQLPELFADKDICLMHGDFHHYNILSSERGWLVIDPKGVIGPAGYEIGPLMLNPWIKPMDRTRFKVQAERRVEIIKERTGWAREKIIGWALAHSVLSAYWDLELDPVYPIEAARIFMELK
jgi:streptomycin 6-kinase